MGTPHKHAKLIKAWADGEAIQSRLANGRWEDAPSPGWYSNKEYRIKPEPKKIQIRFYLRKNKSIGIWQSDWNTPQSTLETYELFSKWLSDTEEREFDV